MNSDHNDVDKTLFPESGIPNIKYFTHGKKSTPIKHAGGRDLNSFIQFIHDNTSYKFDVDEFKVKGDVVTKVGTASKGFEALSSEVKKLLVNNPNTLTNEEKSNIEEKVVVLEEFLGNKSVEKIDNTNQASESIKNSPLYEK